MREKATAPWRLAAQNALREALRLRVQAGIPLSDALDVFGLAEKLGVEVRFVDIGSLEGMYWAGTPPRIFVPAERPPGRQSFTCGHELGHHVFEHGTRLDELVRPSQGLILKDPAERIADAFSGFLLMPKAAVSNGFHKRNWDPKNGQPREYYVVAGWLGVGYVTLLSHMAYSLGMITQSRATALGRVSLKQIRRLLAGRDVTHDLVVIDAAWTGRPIDLRVGDSVLALPGTEAEGTQLLVENEDSHGVLLRAQAPGCGRLRNTSTNSTHFVRVRRNPYVGLARYRHLEETDE